MELGKDKIYGGKNINVKKNLLKSSTGFLKQLERIRLIKRKGDFIIYK